MTPLLLPLLPPATPPEPEPEPDPPVEPLLDPVLDPLLDPLPDPPLDPLDDPLLDDDELLLVEPLPDPDPLLDPASTTSLPYAASTCWAYVTRWVASHVPQISNCDMNTLVADVTSVLDCNAERP